MSLDDQQIERYSRHLILEQVGLAGQEKLLAAKVLVIGVGGLGSPVALYLAAAGVGTLGLVDADVVDRTNLQRQVIHFTSDLGRAKVTSAADKIAMLNPDVTVVKHRERAVAANILSLVQDYDVVVDGTDSFTAKFLINDACVLAGKPFVHAGILRFEGQVMSVVPGRSACYRCVFGAPPPPDAVPSCSQAGVLGALAGVMGCLQATEAVKLLLGIGDPLADRLLTYDGLAMKFREVAVRRSPTCAVCGEHPTITQPIDEAENTCDLK